ncbi:MAG: MBL fold metallo-hydrolase [Chlorobi bacterium]|nr:MBL fold metallo-hydrolase [Chlorobiota bacterium]MCI0714694.1 MBL fold metallo-hydrolase [Chlorobiota bacterium]
MDNFLISPKEVKEHLVSKNDGYLLVDIREEHEYKDWNIKGSMNLPVNSLIVAGNFLELRDILKSLPKDKFIVTICQRGINSQVAASILREMDYNAVALEKGMKGWNENFDLYKIEFTDFILDQFVRIGKGCLSYIVYDNNDSSAAIFEPSIFVGEYEDYISSNGLKIKYVIDTHAHADHFSGAMELARKYHTDYHINETDVDNVFEFKSLKGVKEITFGKVKIEILPTPGHTDGSLSFLINNEALICGDLLLLESPGRPDLARTKEETVKGAEILFNTLQNVIFKLNDNVKIFPAHFTKTELRPVTMTLSELKQKSEGLAISDKNKFIEFLTSNIPMTPPNYESIKRFNKAGVMIPLDYAEDLEIGPNRCAAR